MPSVGNKTSKSSGKEKRYCIYDIYETVEGIPDNNNFEENSVITKQFPHDNGTARQMVKDF
jgi:hypothetical protein